MDIKIVSNGLKFKYRVSAIIINNDQILLSKYDESRYCLPGGYVELGETSEEAIIREIKEEVQIELKNVKYCGIIENFFINSKNQNTHGIDVYYKTNISNDIARNINMDYIEKDKNGLVNHHFIWVKTIDIEEYDLVPSIIKNAIKEKKENFHYINK